MSPNLSYSYHYAAMPLGMHYGRYISEVPSYGQACHSYTHTRHTHTHTYMYCGAHTQRHT